MAKNRRRSEGGSGSGGGSSTGQSGDLTEGMTAFDEVLHDDRGYGDFKDGEEAGLMRRVVNEITPIRDRINSATENAWSKVKENSRDGQGWEPAEGVDSKTFEKLRDDYDKLSDIRSSVSAVVIQGSNSANHPHTEAPDFYQMRFKDQVGYLNTIFSGNDGKALQNLLERYS